MNRTIQKANGTSATTDDNKTVTLTNISSSVFTYATVNIWGKVKQHVNNLPDDIKFTTEKVLKEQEAMVTTKSMGPTAHTYDFLMKHGMNSLRR